MSTSLALSFKATQKIETREGNTSIQEKPLYSSIITVDEMVDDRYSSEQQTNVEQIVQLIFRPYSVPAAT